MPQFTLVSYNLQAFTQEEAIYRNLSALKDRADILCLQEVTHSKGVGYAEKIVARIFSDWEYELFYDLSFDQFHSLCTVWNQKKFNMQKTEKVFLPKLKRLSSRERQFVGENHTQYNRGALVSIFQVNREKFALANVHLDLAGGADHRKEQLHFVKRCLDKTGAGKQIVCGDFNTLGATQFFSKRMQARQAAVQGALGESFENVLPDLLWTEDATINLSPNFPEGPLKWALKTAGFLHIPVYQKLDYIFSKGFTVIPGSAKRLDLKGSDHYPLLVELEL